MDCALAIIPRGRTVSAVFQALGVSRSHVLEKKHRSSDWADRRKSPPRVDDTQVKRAIADVVHKRATYGYRRVWARIRLDGHVGIATRVGVQMGWNCLVTTVNASEWLLHWTAATERS